MSDSMRTSSDDGQFLRQAVSPQGDDHPDPSTADEAAGLGTELERLIAARERVGIIRTDGEHPPDQIRFRRVAARPVDGTAVVGVDERERLVLVALVDVRDARAGELEQRLVERDLAPALGNPRGELLETVGEPLVHARYRLPDPPLVRLARLDPARVPLRLAQRLLHVRLDPAALDRPCSDERLPEQVVLAGIVEDAPAADALAPLVGELGENADPRADVAAALRVVRLRREQVHREALGALEVRPVELLDGKRESARIAADLVQRSESEVAVEVRVLDALGHHRAGRLLPARDELVVAALLEQEHAAEVVGDGCDGVAGLLVDLAAPRL